MTEHSLSCYIHVHVASGQTADAAAYARREDDRWPNGRHLERMTS